MITGRPKFLRGGVQASTFSIHFLQSNIENCQARALCVRSFEYTIECRGEKEEKSDTIDSDPSEQTVWRNASTDR